MTTNSEFDVTVAFCGYNIKNFATLGIESFLHFNPEMRGNVVYFDDASTDGSREALEKRGIKVLSWIPEDLKRLKDAGQESNLDLRVSLIYGSIVKRTETKYLLLIDGDAAFMSNDFFLKAMETIREHDAICVGHRSLICLPDDVCDEYFKNDECEFIRKYLTKFSEGSYFKEKPESVSHFLNGCQMEITPGDYYAERMAPTYLLVNADLLKKHEVFTDIFEDMVSATHCMFANAVFDTWASWFYLVKQLGYPIIALPLHEIEESVVHFDAISTQLKFPHAEPIWRAINYIKRDPIVAKVCSFAGLPKDFLVLDLLNGTKGKEIKNTPD